MAYTTSGTWEGEDEGDTKLKYFSFDLFTLSINIYYTIQRFDVFSFIFS